MYQPELEQLPRPELTRLQLERLQATLQLIRARNPTYARRLGEAGAEGIHSLDDLTRLPTISKDDLRQAYPFGLACAPQSEFVRIQMSSGTTGTPILCPYTWEDVQQWGEVMGRCLSSAGIGSGDVLQITPSFGLFNGGFGFHYGGSSVQAMIIPIGPGRTKLQLQFIQDLGTTALAAIASYPLRLIEVAAQEGFDFHRDSHLRVGILGAEIWSDPLRRRIEDIMGIETFDIIGMTETGGVGLGIDCTMHHGIHVWEDHYLVEVLDHASGVPVADGSYGELVITTLTRKALPLIRFRSRDITRVISREPCDCGRTSLRLDRLACRIDDMVKVKGVNFYPKQLESILLEHRQVANDYLIHLDRVDGKDCLQIMIESTTPDDQGLADQIDAELYTMLGLHAEIKLVTPGSLERPAGKAVRLVDYRNQ